MSNSMITLDAEDQYVPDFKLKVVLEYIKNPKRKKRGISENGINEELLGKWHQEFIKRAAQIFASPSSPLVSPTNVIPSTGKSSIENQGTELSALGVRINKSRYESFSSPASKKDIPSWADRAARGSWQEPGVVVWNDANRKIEKLTAGETLELLGRLRERGYWRTSGIPITRKVHQRKLTESPRNQSQKKKKTEAPPEEDKAEWEVVDQILFRLDPRIGEEFFAFLQEHEFLLKQMADEEKKEFEIRMSEVYYLLFGEARKQEEQQVDLTPRSLKWSHQPESHTFVCNHGSDRGTVVLNETKVFWRAYIERPDRFKQWSSLFMKLEEALAWVEYEFPSPKDTAIEPGSLKIRDETEELGKETRSRTNLTPYWINPADLEPKRLSFRVIIDLNHAPESFDTMEMSFGKLYRYNQEFPPTAQVVRELRMDPAQITAEQLLGPYDDWYRLHSADGYYEMEVASAQAQQLWTQSSVHSLYKEGKIRRARYGVEEVETHFPHWLGGLDDPEQPWSQASRREKHMSALAMRETLAYALDVVGFREFIGFSPDESSDDELLKRLHEKRALSRYIPEHAKAESARWLKEHGEEKPVVN